MFTYYSIKLFSILLISFINSLNSTFGYKSHLEFRMENLVESKKEKILIYNNQKVAYLNV